MSDLSAAAILAALSGTRFRHVEVHPELPSTQTLLVSQGGRDGRVVVADHQTAGRGRAGRSWLSIPDKALLFSVLIRGIPAEQAPLLTLAAGLAVVRGVDATADVAARLKWPNDVLLGGRKLCGILGELAPGGDHLVIGIGINVRQTEVELPPDVPATSLRIAGAGDVSRSDLLSRILRELDPLTGASDWIDDYRRLCATLGMTVRVETASGIVEGEATDVRDDGALVVDGRPVLAGDVVHVRPPTAT